MKQYPHQKRYHAQSITADESHNNQRKKKTRVSEKIQTHLGDHRPIVQLLCFGLSPRNNYIIATRASFVADAGALFMCTSVTHNFVRACAHFAREDDIMSRFNCGRKKMSALQINDKKCK